MAGGKFITFEGGEGAGKSTQAGRLATYLAQQKLKTLLTREPGGCALAEDIRKLVLSQRPVSADAEFLLFSAARSEHVATKIVPALEAGTWVICDRFIDSTRVYQGVLTGVDTRLISAVEQLTDTSRAMPDLTIVIDVPVDVSVERAQTRGALSRYDAARPEDHQKIRDGFLAIAKAEPDRCVVIEGACAADTVTQMITQVVAERLLQKVT